MLLSQCKLDLVRSYFNARLPNSVSKCTWSTKEDAYIQRTVRICNMGSRSCYRSKDLGIIWTPVMASVLQLSERIDVIFIIQNNVLNIVDRELTGEVNMYFEE